MKQLLVNMKSFILLGKLILIFQIFVGEFINLTNGAKIIVLLPIASTSNKIVFDPLVKALALNDHDLTVVSPVPTPGYPISVKEIHPVTVEELGYGISGNGKDLFETRQSLKLTNHFIPTLWNTSLVDNGCHKLYQDVEIKYLMKGFKRFDLAIVSGLQNECALGLVYHFKVPHIYLTTTAAPNFVVSRFGHYFPTSVVPSPYLTYDDKMTFLERTVNFVVENLLVAVANVYLYPHYEEIYRSYVGMHAPGIDEIDDNLGVILMNSNYVMSHPRPLPPNIIEVGGMHCHPPHPLPTELDKFLSYAKNGFIYFSLGSVLKAKDVPETVVQVFLDVFSNIDQRVIWKWDQDIPNLPKNVMLGHWLPQQDILGHPNIKLFISNGGLLSTQEAIYHGVPLLGIPLTAEHDLNMELAENSGYALTWEIMDLNKTELQDLIDSMLDGRQYRTRARQLSKMYRDSPELALEKAVFWTEYVIRNKGAPNLRSSSKDLKYFEYYCLDVIVFLVTVMLALFYALYYVISCVCCCKRKPSSVSVPDQRNGTHVSNVKTCKNKHE